MSKVVTLITAALATKQCKKIEKQVMAAITAYMNSLPESNSLPGSKFLDVENAGKYITWFDTCESKLLVQVQHHKNGQFFLHNDSGEIDRLDTSVISTFDLITILAAIEISITVKV